MADDRFQAYIREHSQQLHELVVTLARIPAPTGKEERRAKYCMEWLLAHGAKETYMDAAGNVIYPYGESGNGPLIVFAAHMDVVFPDETELPLAESDGRICCPGIGDNTANLAVLLMTAAYAAKYRPDTGKYGVLFVCDVGEEGLGNLKGAREICSVFGSRIRAFYGLDLTMDSYTCRAVGSLRYRVKAHTSGGHSYHCFGNTNANVVLAELIVALYRLQVPENGKTTYNVGMISGGTSVNSIAQSAELLYEIRSDDASGLEEMRQRFEKTLESCRSACPEDCVLSAELIGERPCECGVNQKDRERLFEQVERAVFAVTGKVPVPEPVSTDCNIPLSMGIPSVCVGTCRGAGEHTREEYIEKDSVIQGLQVALELLHDSVC